MRRTVIITLLCLSALLIGATGVIHADGDSCTDWMLQDNGCYWRTCVDSQGSQYCEQCCGKNCSRVKCS
ncbi:MAG: hypothetical protein ABSE25_08725 [Syntrophorhabdales bacterium]|jgi:hypothetical protein